jgi:hypothetical protein
MLYHVKQANLLMRTADFNNDGSSDCIGIHAQDIRIITDPRMTPDLLGKSRLTSTMAAGSMSNYWSWNANSGEMCPEDYMRTFSK